MFASSSSCVIHLTEKTTEDYQVLIQARNFNEACYEKNYSRIWDLASPWLRRELGESGGTRESYVYELDRFFQGSKITHFVGPQLMIFGEKYAVTQAEITLNFREENKREVRLTICERTLWLKFSEGWYWHKANLHCAYSPTKDEIKHLTRNLR